MELYLKIKMNEKLFLRDPEQTELGKKIIRHSIQLIYKNGFELFTFKKLAEDIGTTEAGIYRYFENKHRLLIYITAWYWGWLQYRVVFNTNNIKDPAVNLFSTSFFQVQHTGIASSYPCFPWLQK